MYLLMPLLICVLGLLVYALSSNAKVAELGRLAFFAGMFVTLWQFAGHIVALGH